MKTHIIRDGAVVNTILATVDEAQIAFPGDTCIDGSSGGIGWTWDGDKLSPPPETPEPEPTLAEIVATYESALDAFLDAKAQEFRFADRTRLALRAAYPNAWQPLGVAFGTWMDQCNVQVAAGLQEVINGNRPIPTVESMLAELPAFIPPEGFE